ncbi:unnamed protein product [Urochloa humidicola]
MGGLQLRPICLFNFCSLPSPNRRTNKTLEDSICFLETMKRKLTAGEMDKYYEFIAVMRTFKARRMDTEVVANYVKCLLAGHQDLIRGFREFLPLGYIRCHGPLVGTVI